MADVTSDIVQFDLAQGVRTALAKIRKSSQQVESAFGVSIDADYQRFATEVTRYLGETFVEQLQVPENRESFNTRMINLRNFFDFTMKMPGSLRNCINLRRRIEDATVSAVIDLSLNLAMMGVESWSAAKNVGKKVEEAAVEAEFKSIVNSEAKGFVEKYSQDLYSRIVACKDSIEELLKLKSSLKDAPRSLGRDPLAVIAEIGAADSKLAVLETERKTLMEVRRRLTSMANMDDLPLAQRWEKAFLEEGQTQLKEQAQKEILNNLKVLADEWNQALAPWRLKVAGLAANDPARLAVREVERQLAQSIEMGNMKALEVFKDFSLDVVKNFVGDSLKSDAETLRRIAEEQRKKDQGWMAWLSDKFFGFFSFIWAKLCDFGGTLAQAWNESPDGWCGLYGLGSMAIQAVLWCLKQICLIAAWLFNLIAYMAEVELPIYHGLTKRARDQGTSVATAKGVPEGFFSGQGQKSVLAEWVNKVRPDRMLTPVKSRSEAASIRSGMIAEPQAAVSSASEERRSAVGQFMAQICRDSLDPERMKQVLEDRRAIQLVAAYKALGLVLENMQAYERALSRQDNDIGYLDYVSGLVGDMYNLEYSWADIGNYLQLLGNSVAQLLRLFAMGCMVTGVGAPAGVAAYEFAEGADKISSLFRVIIAAVASKPIVNSFAYDLVALEGIVYIALVEGKADIEDLMAPPPEAPPPDEYVPGGAVRDRMTGQIIYQ